MKSVRQLPILFLLFLIGCEKNVEEEHKDGTIDCSVIETYYTENIAPILITSCTSCHSGSSPKGELDLSTYTTVKASLPTILDRVNRAEGTPGFMPSGGPKLSNANLDTLYSFSQMECDE